MEVYDLKVPNLLKLKWKNFEKIQPKYDDYYVIKHTLTHFEWYLSYYLKKENKFLRFSREDGWQAWTEQPWMWAPLPRIEQENTLFDMEHESEQ